MRRTVELFNRSLDSCNEVNEVNESRIAVVDFLDIIVSILIDLNKHLNQCVAGMWIVTFLLRCPEIIT